MPTNARLLPDGRRIGLLLSHFVYPQSGEIEESCNNTSADRAGREEYFFSDVVRAEYGRDMEGNICDECYVQQHGVLLRFSAFNAIRFLMISTLCVSAVILYRISIAIYRMSILYIESLWLSIDFLYFLKVFI